MLFGGAVGWLLIWTLLAVHVACCNGRLSRSDLGTKAIQPALPRVIAASSISEDYSAIESKLLAPRAARKLPFRELRPLALSVGLPWLYFLCASINLTTLPKFVNWALNGGSATVSAQSAKVYGYMQGLDALFTFLSVNLVGVLSDIYGRKPFMILSSAGLGASYLIMLRARRPELFFLASAIDGLTSCMLSQAQALSADLHGESNLSITLSRFQGLAIGMAFAFGVPLGSFIEHRFGIDAPLKVSAALCLLNCALLAALLPAPRRPLADAREPIRWLQASPFGAVKMLSSSHKLRIGALVYLVVAMAHAGMQATWVNYLAYRFGWSPNVSGATLVLIGVAIALLPPVVIRCLGTLSAIRFSLCAHALSLLFLALNDWSVAVFLAMPFLAVGSSVMPMLLGHLTHQVGENQVGALQGACDTARTVASALGAPLFARFFAMTLSQPKRFSPGLALYLCALTSALGSVLFLLYQ